MTLGMTFSSLSLARRLLLASTLMLPLFLGLTGFFLDSAFQRSLTAAIKERLQGHIYLLFSVAELQDNGGDTPVLHMPLALIEPEFERLDSGLYAFIYDGADQLIWRSGSVGLKPTPNTLANTPFQPGELIVQTLGYNEKTIFSAHFDVIWLDDTQTGHPFRFLVLRNLDGYHAELAAYRRHLWQWLGVAALLLLLTQSVVLQWGLRPLKRLARSLDAMHSGHSNRLSGEYPQELQEVVANLNQVLSREEALRQRYRNSLSDLAHSLKTPLAVLQGSLGQDTPADTLRDTAAEQSARMYQVVHYQLQRAVSGQQPGLYRCTPLLPVVQRLSVALNKVYRDKQITCVLQIAEDLAFAGDEQDLMELLGNLLENAYKYGRSQIEISAHPHSNGLQVIIGDDGPGIPAEQRSRILERGQRLDTALPGQGIGLAVAADIIASYQGQITLTTSPLGGARFQLQLPLARR